MSAVPAIGTLPDRIELRRRVVTGEPEGGALVSFAPVATVWARVRPLEARLSLESDAAGQRISHSVVLRFRADVSPGDRVLYRGRVLEVRAAADLNGRRAWLSCQCSERAVTG